LSFADLTIKPLQRLTRYKLLLEAIQKKTHDVQQKNDLNAMVECNFDEILWLKKVRLD
jgi:pleckstrin domain-containing family G protein 5